MNHAVSAIIPEEVLRLHMVEESERLMSEIKRDEAGNKLFLINVMVRIYRYESVNDWGKRELIYENKGFIVSRFMRWKWFWRHLQAKEQLKTPKKLVQIETISYVNPDHDTVLLKVLTNKLIAAKRDRTRVQLSIEKGKQMHQSTSMFTFEDDPQYIKALEYLSKKQQLIADIEAEIAQLTSKITPK